jgi:hypothetical protein
MRWLSWTVYEEPYDGHEPTDIWWHDVRADQALAMSNGVPIPCSPVWWELNWAAYSATFYKSKLAAFPDHYGVGISHENSAFAVECLLAGGTCMLDPKNFAIGLPHKHYWPEQEAEGLPHSLLNKDLFWNEYGAVIASLQGRWIIG